MTAEEYQNTIHRFDMSPMTDWYYGLGLNGEAGEVAEILKKAYRARRSVNRGEIANELGDVLWYLTRLATLFGFTLGEIMSENVAKLEVRAAEGKITG